MLHQVERLTGEPPEERLISDIDQLAVFRNRIVHMSYHARPDRYRSMLNTGQVLHIAALASECARQYLDFLSYEFSELKLPIKTIRPTTQLDDQVGDRGE